MKTTLKERKQKLFDKTTEARIEYHRVVKEVREQVMCEHPQLAWSKQYDFVEADARVKVAEARLFARCDACRYMGIECGDTQLGIEYTNI